MKLPVLPTVSILVEAVSCAHSFCDQEDMLMAIQVLGALFASWSAEKLGRKRSIFIGAVLATIGGALQAGCPQHIAAFLIFRFINGLGVGESGSWMFADTGILT